MKKELKEKKPKCDIRLSYSRVSKFASLGAKELNDETRTIIINDGISFGKLVDLLEQNIDIKDEYYIYDGLKPTAMLGQLCEAVVDTYEDVPSKEQVLDLVKTIGLWSSTKVEETIIKKFDKDGFWDYIKAQLESENKTIVTTSELIKAKEKVGILRTHEFTKHIFDNQDVNIEIIDQKELLFSYRGFDFKSFLDKLIIDHKNKTIRIIDLKTGIDSPYNFSFTFKKWKYYLQEALYIQGIKESYKEYIDKGYTLLPFQFVYISKTNDLPIIYEVTKEWSKAALKGFSNNGYTYKGLDELLDDIYWHWFNNSYTLPRYLIEQNGIVEIENNINTNDE